jgi:hypothetical protein
MIIWPEVASMKKGALVLSLVLLLMFSLLYFGCGSGGTSSSGSFFYNVTTSTTPVFNPSASGRILRALDVNATSTTEWGSGNPLYAVYFSCREFLSSRDEGSVDRSNIYKMMIDVDSVFTSISNEAQTITSQVITPPYASLPTKTCEAVKNDETNKKAIALKVAANIIDSIMTWIWTDSPSKQEYGIAVVGYDTSTKDLNIDMTYSVDYDLSSTATDYNLRCQLSGNPEAHSFQFKYVIGSATAASAQLVGKGISRGAGNYMLFKYTGWSVGTRYIVVPGTADESYFVAQNTTPTAIYTNPDDLPAMVSEYKTWVVDATFLATSEMMTDTANLNISNPKAGTIYINYN